MPGLLPAPLAAPESIRIGLTTAATAWYDDPSRPRLSGSICERWGALLDEWAAAEELPLIVRKARGNRGHVLQHHSGRAIVPADNSPAHWSLSLAFADVCPTLDEVRSMLASDQVPVAMVFNADEKQGARYRCTRQSVRGPNQLGWKVAHIYDVGLGYTGALAGISLDALRNHMKRFLAPGNMFLVPKEYAGVAETPEFLEAFRQRAGA